MSDLARTARYAKAVEQELASGNRWEPVWKEILATAGGDEAAARERYIQLRVDQIAADEAGREAVDKARRKQRRLHDSQALTVAQKNALLGLGIIIVLTAALYLLLRK